MQISNVDDCCHLRRGPLCTAPLYSCLWKPWERGGAVLKPGLRPYALLCAHRSALPSGRGGTDGRTSTRSAPAWPAPCPSPPPPPVSAFTVSNSPQQSELEGHGIPQDPWLGRWSPGSAGRPVCGGDQLSPTPCTPRSSWHGEPGRPLPHPQLSRSSRPLRAVWATG